MEKEEKEEKQKHQARHRCIGEGIFASAKNSFGGNYIAPFAIAINSSNALVAMLSSVSGLLGPLSQIFGSKLIEKHPRKKIVLRSVFLETLIWLPLIAVAILFYKGILISSLPFFLLLFFAIYVILANLGYPAWFSWIGDIVDEKYRGRWFAKRSFLLEFFAVVLTISASFFLDYFKNNNLLMQGFIILFSLALISRLISWKILRRQYEPKIKLEKNDYFSFWDFLKNARKTNFGKFVFFRAILNFATYISAPLLAVYLLRELKFSYVTYMIVLLAGTVFSIIVIQLWGKFADKYGNYRTIKLACIIIPLLPILWILSPSPIYLILVPSPLGAISWAGFSLATGNFIYDSVSKPKRGLAVSYYNMLSGIAIFLGAGISALLIKYLNTSFLKPIFIIFILGGIARLLAIIIFLPRIKEIRKTKKFRGVDSLKHLIIKEIKPTLVGDIHELTQMKKYFNYK